MYRFYHIVIILMVLLGRFLLTAAVSAVVRASTHSSAPQCNNGVNVGMHKI